MYNKRHVFFIFFVLIFTIGAISSASASDMNVVSEDLSSYDEAINVEESNEITNDVADNNAVNEYLMDDSNKNNPNEETTDTHNENNIDDEIIGNSINSPYESSLLKSDSPNSENSIYFDASAGEDGDGSIETPYKYLNANRIAPGVTAYFANGTYYLDSPCAFSGVKLIGEDQSKTIINSKVSDQYDFIVKENSSLEIRGLYLHNVQILNQGTLIANNVLFEGNDLFDFKPNPEISSISGMFNRSIGSLIVCDTPRDIKTTVILDYCDIEKAYDGFNGGVISAVNSNITILHTLIQQYSSTYKGGAIYCLNSSLYINRSTFEPKTISDESEDFTLNNRYNYTSYYGGTVFCENSNVTIYNATFLGSVSFSLGGCIASINSNMTIDLTEFNNSKSLIDGGGVIYNSKGKLFINNSIFNNNSAEFGGAICNLNSILESYNSQYYNNTANYFGGVIYDIYGSLNLNQNNFTRANALIGGSIYSRIPDEFNVSGNSFYHSYAKEGLSIFLDGKEHNTSSNFISGDANSINHEEFIDPLNTAGLDLYNSYGNDYHIFVEFTATLNGEEYSLQSNTLEYKVSPPDAIEPYDNPTFIISDGQVSIGINDLDYYNHTRIITDSILHNISVNIAFSDQFINPVLNFYLCSDVSYLFYDYYNFDRSLIQIYSVNLSDKIIEGNYNITELCYLDFGNPFLNIKYNNLYEASSFSPVSLVNYSINSSSYNFVPSSSSNSGITPSSSSTNPYAGLTNGSNELTSYFNSDDFGSVSAVKDQGNGGNCWAFAGLATLEACLKKATGITFDFSEENAKNLMAAYSVFGLKLETNYGGYDSMLMSYLASWLGPIDESIENYDDYSSISLQADPMFHIQNIKFLPARSSSSDNDLFKEAIRDNGAVSVTIKWGKDYHAISLVGWDDDFVGYDSLGNYATGAWIFKNSWGNNWGYNGFGYLSYDASLSEELGYSYMHAYTFIFNDTNPYTKIYQYDFAGVSEIYPIYGDVYYKNVFVADGNSRLSAFSTYFDRDTNFTVMVYKGNQLVLSQNGFCSAGYYTVPFNELIQLDDGDEFSIVVRNHNNDVNCIPICRAEEITKKTFSENVSFISYDGVNWIDLYDYESDCQVACIKAFTQDIGLTSIKINVNNFSVVNTRNINIKVNFDNWYDIKSINFCLVKYVINNKTYYAQIKDGKAYLNINLENGINSLFVQYKDNIYESNIVQFNFTVNSNYNNQSFNALQDIINNAAENSTINLNRDYFYDEIFDDGNYGVYVNKTLTINGNGHIISGLFEATGFLISANNVILNNITFNSTTSVNGGALYISSHNVKLNNCKFISNKASNYGGAIYSLFNISINNCQFTYNSANTGGALYIVNDGTTIINNSYFNYNEAWTEGSAVYIIGNGHSLFSSSSFYHNGAVYCGGTVVSNVNSNNFTNCSFSNNFARYGAGAFSTAQLNEFSKCTFSNNKALLAGGAIIAYNLINIYNSIFINNTEIENILDFGEGIYLFESFGGGAIYSFDILNIYDSKFINNHAGTDGGAIFASKYLNVYRSNFTNNSASNKGGAAFGSYWGMITFNMGMLKFSDAHFYDSIFINNSAGKYGGALYSMDNMSVSSSKFINNSALVGGAIINGDLVNNCTFANNHANNSGGAIYYADAINDCSFTNNSANYGGAIFNVGEGVSYYVSFINNSNFTGNSANYGGALYMEYDTEIYNSLFIKNHATDSGGAIFCDVINVSSSSFTSNSANYGGAIIAFKNINVSSSNFTANSASVAAGAVYCVEKSILLDSIFEKNSAIYGGAILMDGNYWNNNSINISSSSFTSNSANYGGAIYSVGNMSIASSGFIDNLAEYGVDMYSIYCLNITDSNFKSNKSYGKIYFTYYYDGESDNSYGNLYLKNNKMDIKGIGIIYAENEIPYSSPLYLVFNEVTAIRGEYIDLCKLENEGGNSIYTYEMDSITFTLTNMDTNDVINCNVVFNEDSGSFRFKVPSLDFGTYQITGTLPNSFISDYTIKSGVLNVVKKTIISSSGLTKAYGKGDKLIITLKDEFENPMANVYVDINLNGKTSTVLTNENGQVALAVDLAPNTYTATISFAGNETHSNASSAVKVIIKKATPAITASKQTFKIYVKSKSYTISLKDNLGKAMKNVQVKISMNGKTYTAYTNSEGKASFKLTNQFKKGTFKATITYAGNAYYTSASTTAQITIIKANPKIVASKKTFKAKAKTKKYTITLKDDLGKAMKKAKVKIKVKGKTYTAKTNSKGKATFKLKNLTKKGNLKATITYAGNAYYNAVSKKVKITIKK